MAFHYQAPPTSGPLRQGELLGPVWEHQATSPASEHPAGAALPYISVQHSFVMVISQDCDLLWDFNARFESDQSKRDLHPEIDGIDDHPSCVPHVLLCDTFAHDDIRPRIKGSDIWKRIRGNQDERYHRFDSAPVILAADDGTEDQVGEFPDLFLDFKKALALPTRQLYLGLREASVPRLALVPPIYLHDLIHRFFGYHSRVALPEP